MKLSLTTLGLTVQSDTQYKLLHSLFSYAECGMLSVVYFTVFRFYAECHYAECRYAECRGAQK
jgi:hypothetical protein